jgi:hypothetical protein
LDSEHAVPQVPQFVAVVSEASQPLAGLPSQSPKPDEQAPVAQEPPTQLGVPFAVVQALPHVPQLAVVVTDTSQPLAGLPSQSA